MDGLQKVNEVVDRASNAICRRSPPPLSHFMEVTYLLNEWPASEIESSTMFGDTGDFLTIH